MRHHKKHFLEYFVEIAVVICFVLAIVEAIVLICNWNQIPDWVKWILILRK